LSKLINRNIRGESRGWFISVLAGWDECERKNIKSPHPWQF
jgi:hypothetical protein